MNGVGDAMLVVPRETPPWDLVIKPRSGWSGLSIGELWGYRDLIWLLVHRDFVAFYKQTILGPLWFFLHPLLTTLIYTLVFGRIAGLSTDGLPLLAFYLAGVTNWNYFAECFIKTSETFTGNAELFGKVYFPRLIMPLAIVISNLVRYAIQLALFLIVWGWYVGTGAIAPNRTLWLLPYLVLVMATIALGMGLLFSAVTTKYRDLRFVIQFGVQLLMFATPIIYPMSMVEGRLREVMRWNPLAPLIETFRHGFLGAGDFSWLGLAWSGGFSLGLLALGVVVFHYSERTFIDTV